MGNENSQSKKSVTKGKASLSQSDQENVDQNQKKIVDKNIKKIQKNMPAYMVAVKKQVDEIKKRDEKNNDDLENARTLLGLQPCTKMKYGPEPMSQDGWFCETCLLNKQARKVICRECVDYCHEGCEISYVKKAKMVCACDSKKCCYKESGWLNDKIGKLVKQKEQIKTMTEELVELKAAYKEIEKVQ